MEKNKIGVFIIDIVGKGIKSSYATIWLKALFQREINKGISNSPKKIMTALNNAMYSETNLSIRYGSGFYASIDTQNYTIKYCDCGIGVANLYRKSTISELRDYGGIGIGWANNSIYTDGSITLKKHDVIMLSTDGIENIINDCGKKVGPQLLNQLILKRNKNVSLIQSISKGINSLSNQSIKDDIALVCIEC